MQHNWTPEEKQFLIDNYEKAPISFICDYLELSYDVVSSRARNLNLLSLATWRIEDLNTIRNEYPTKGAVIAEKLGRTKASIRCQAHLLGVRFEGRAKSSFKLWSIEEINILQDNFKRNTYKELSALLNRPIKSVKNKAERLGLRKHSKYK